MACHNGSVLATGTWIARLGACVLIGIVTFVSAPATGRDLVVEIVAYAICVVATAYWLYADLRTAGPSHPAFVTSMWIMAAVAGVVTMAPSGGAFIGFVIMAVIAAAADPARLAGWAISATAAVAILVGLILFDAGTGNLLDYGLVLLVSVIGGRHRRSYRIQAQQSAAMVAQLEQLRAEQHRVAVLDERNRIAREIHDVLAHSLGALGIHLQVVRAVLTEQHDAERAATLLDQAQRMAGDGLVETRRAVEALRGDDTRLDQQITALIEVHRGRHRASVDFAVDGEPATLPPEATIALIRTAQEALVNTAKHAPHQPIRVRLSYDADQVRLRIENALPEAAVGTTFSSVNGGYGLTGMRERLLLINGTLTTGSDDRNWTVAARVPR
jgi:signal transduction histidine kinase